MRSRVSGVTSGLSASARDTVILDTPASFARSAMVRPDCAAAGDFFLAELTRATSGRDAGGAGSALARLVSPAAAAPSNAPAERRQAAPQRLHNEMLSI